MWLIFFVLAISRPFINIRKRMRCTTHIYLTALAVADIFYLVFVFVRSLQHYPNTEKYMFYWSTYGLQHWFTDAACECLFIRTQTILYYYYQK